MTKRKVTSTNNAKPADLNGWASILNALKWPILVLTVFFCIVCAEKSGVDLIPYFEATPSINFNVGP